MNERHGNWLRQLLTEGESEQVEFKKRMDGEALETVAAFANTHGGTLLVGVADDGTVKGVTLGKETLRDWANHIAQATRVHPQISPLSHQDRTIVVLEVPESPLKPVPCRGRYFKRVGSSNRQMKDTLTEEHLQATGLNERQIKAMLFVKEQGRITNHAYRQLNQVSNKTAYLELNELAEKGLLRREGTGKATSYVPAKG